MYVAMWRNRGDTALWQVIRDFGLCAQSKPHLSPRNLEIGQEYRQSLLHIPSTLDREQDEGKAKTMATHKECQEFCRIQMDFSTEIRVVTLILVKIFKFNHQKQLLRYSSVLLFQSNDAGSNPGGDVSFILFYFNSRTGHCKSYVPFFSCV